MGRYNSHFRDYFNVRSVIEHLDQIAEIMTKKYGIDDMCLTYVDKGLREKFKKQEEKLRVAIDKNMDRDLIVKLGRGMIRAWKIVDGECESKGVKKIDTNVWQAKHDNLPNTIINVTRYRKQLPLNQKKGEAWISIEGLVNTMPKTVFKVKEEFKGSRVSKEVDDFYDDPIPF